VKVLRGAAPLRRAVPPLRSVLFAAGSDASELRSFLSSGADALIVDLEEPQTPMNDGVRLIARRNVAEFLDGLPPYDGAAAPGAVTRPLIFCRVQPARTGGLWPDLMACLRPSLAGIVLPKSYGPDDVVAAEGVLVNAEAERGVVLGSTLLYPIFETAEAIRVAYDIAMASPRVAYMGGAVSRFGDIHQALGYRWTPAGGETHWLRSKLLVDARAAGVRYPISGMWGGANDDLDGLRTFATELRDLGYYGMMLGNPDHVSIVHEIFSPVAADVAYWTELVRLGDEAQRTGVGPVLFGDANAGEGHVVHGAHVESARLNLEWATDLGY
jgi:citrate lyase subunit beta/citryl-CoA lyase